MSKKDVVDHYHDWDVREVHGVLSGLTRKAITRKNVEDCIDLFNDVLFNHKHSQFYLPRMIKESNVCEDPSEKDKEMLARSVEGFQAVFPFSAYILMAKLDEKKCPRNARNLQALYWRMLTAVGALAKRFVRERMGGSGSKGSKNIPRK